MEPSPTLGWTPCTVSFHPSHVLRLDYFSFLFNLQSAVHSHLSRFSPLCRVVHSQFATLHSPIQPKLEGSFTRSSSDGIATLSLTNGTGKITLPIPFEPTLAAEKDYTLIMDARYTNTADPFLTTASAFIFGSAGASCSTLELMPKAIRLSLSSSDRRERNVRPSSFAMRAFRLSSVYLYG